jgi:GGDEF domain-containing protein
MYKPKAIPSIRLPKLFDLPTADDVGRCTTQAQKMRGRAVELPWQSPQQTGDFANVDCVLQATWFKDDEEPTFAFYKGDAGVRDTRWKHQTRDLGLISILCQRECLGADADLESKDRLSAGNKKAAEPEPEAAPPAPSGSAHVIPGLDPGLGSGIAPFAGFPSAPPMAPFAAFPATPGLQPTQPALAAQAVVPDAPALPLPVPLETSGEANRMGFASVEKKPSRATSMQGDLANMKAPIVLQSIVAGKMTGLLDVTHNEATIEMFVDEGNPVHASAPDCKGEAAIMELLTWDQGKFQFFSDERTTERTVVKRLENILMESAPLIDQFRFLNQTGVTLDSYLIRKHLNISEMEFEQRIARGAKADLLKQKQFYQVLDGQSNLFELLRKMPLAKVDWIPCVYNLVVCDLATVLAVPSQGAKSLPIEGTGVDRSVITTAMQGMYRPDTGLINYPAILYFLEQEFFRWEHTAAPFSLVIFDMCKRTPTGIEALPVASIREAAKRIDTVKRNVDYLSHFEISSFLLFMPNTKVQAAAHVARRISDLLRDQSLGGELDSASLAMAFGVAGIPEDCNDLGLLLAAGKQAMGLSKQTGNPVVPFSTANRT